jgi:hypothetical protein
MITKSWAASKWPSKLAVASTTLAEVELVAVAAGVRVITPGLAGAGRWTRSRDVPTFALVSSDDRNAGENG